MCSSKVIIGVTKDNEILLCPECNSVQWTDHMDSYIVRVHKSKIISDKGRDDLWGCCHNCNEMLHRGTERYRVLADTLRYKHADLH